MIASLRHSGSPVGEATLALLQSPHPSLLTGALTSLINELAALSQDTALILDDYHLIREQAIHDSLQFLLDHLPPCLHLLLASRGDPKLPLACLRAREQVVEIRDAGSALERRRSRQISDTGHGPGSLRGRYRSPGKAHGRVDRRTPIGSSLFAQTS